MKHGEVAGWLTRVFVRCGGWGVVQVMAVAEARQCNLRCIDDSHVSVALDETTTLQDVDDLLAILAQGKSVPFTAASLAPEAPDGMHPKFARTSSFMTHPVCGLNRLLSEPCTLRVTEIRSDCHAPDECQNPPCAGLHGRDSCLRYVV